MQSGRSGAADVARRMITRCQPGPPSFGGRGEAEEGGLPDEGKQMGMTEMLRAGGGSTTRSG